MVLPPPASAGGIFLLFSTLLFSTEKVNKIRARHTLSGLIWRLSGTNYKCQIAVSADCANAVCFYGENLFQGRKSYVEYTFFEKYRKAEFVCSRSDLLPFFVCDFDRRFGLCPPASRQWQGWYELVLCPRQGARATPR